MYISTPSRTMKKLTYQWSSPNYLVVKVRDNTCTVVPLVSAAGREGRAPKAVEVNLSKVKFHSSPPSGFWLGCRVLRKFDKQWFQGAVDDITVDEGQTYFHVTFEDFDEQELDLGEVLDSVVFHPEMEVSEDALTAVNLPDLDSVILFPSNYKPCLGRVVEIQPHAVRPVVVQLLRPSRMSKDFVSAKFVPAAPDGEVERRALTIPQVRIRDLVVSEAGYLDSRSRKKVGKLLASWRRR